jgi:hypothetical protein
MIALVIVSGLLVFSFMAYAEALDASSEIKNLKNLMDQVATKCIEMVSLATVTNASSDCYVQMPPSIGNSQYWLQLHNDSSEAWLEGGLGQTVVEGTDMQVYLLSNSFASGVYVSEYGAVHLQCTVEGSVPHITLTGLSMEG